MEIASPPYDIVGMVSMSRIDPTCHPDRHHWAKGLCRSCYGLQYRRNKGRKPRAKEYNTVQEWDPWKLIPPRVAGVEQHATTSFPLDGCPHCGNRLLVYEGRMAHCSGKLAGCGATVFLVNHSTMPPVRSRGHYDVSGGFDELV